MYPSVLNGTKQTYEKIFNKILKIYFNLYTSKKKWNVINLRNGINTFFFYIT